MQPTRPLRNHYLNILFIMLLLTLMLGLLSTQAQATTTATNCAVQTDIPQAECQTLVALFNSTDGFSWLDRDGWNVTNTPCSWFGIICSNGHVQEIDLYFNELDGTLPNLSSLTQLEGLGLSDNKLSGSIPDLSALTSLKYLNLDGNQLTGSAPNLSTLTELEDLGLSYNQLTGSIPNLSSSPKLIDVYLNDNQFSGSIPALSSLTQLQALDLGNNQLTGFIPDISALTNLDYLYLNNNQLDGSLPNITPLSGLREVWLHNNQLSGSIPDITLLTSLQELYLQNNQLNGTVLASVCNATSLDLGYNKLEVETAVSCIDTANPGWKTTQTAPPTNVTSTSTSDFSIQLTWDAIAYTQHNGHYEIWGKVQGDATFTLNKTTSDKTVTNTTINGLQPNTTYEFFIRTFTPSHGEQQNDLTSVDSATVSTTTSETFYLFLPTIISSP